MRGRTGRDVLLVILLAAFFLGVPALLYFDYKLYGEQTSQHFPDHLLALIAIAAGIIAIYYERKLDREFHEQRVEIKKIVESVLTRYIGNWPGHISEITGLVKDTRPGDQLLIFVDFLGYAHFTRRDLFMEYLKELQNARHRGVKVRMLLHSEGAMKTHLDWQFEKEKSNAEEGKKLAEKYQAAYGYLIKNGRLQSYHDFVTGVLYVHACFCDSLLDATTAAPAEIAWTPSGRSDNVYYWLVREWKDPDDEALKSKDLEDQNLEGENLKNMIFAYSRFTGVRKGYGFKTADSQLMTIFSRDFNRLWKDEKTKIIRRGSDLVPEAWKEAKKWNLETDTKAASGSQSE